MNKACAVTGAAGFVGSHLAERLRTMGYAVVGVDDFSSGRRENLASFLDHPGFSCIEADIREPGLLERLKAEHPGLRVCFHLAAVVSVPYSVDHPEETLETNHRATVRLLREAERLGFDSFVFAGSAAEYGDDERMPLREEYATDATRRLSPYGLSKYLASKDVAASRIGTAIRFFNIYGPRQDPGSPYSGVISRFVDMARSGLPIAIFGDGRQTRDFVYVSDVVDAYLPAAGMGRPERIPNGVFNVGTGASTSILDLAEAVRGVFGNGSGLRFLPERPGDIRHSLADVERFRKTTGWTPKVSLREGLRRTTGA